MRASPIEASIRSNGKSAKLKPLLLADVLFTHRPRVATISSTVATGSPHNHKIASQSMWPAQKKGPSARGLGPSIPYCLSRCCDFSRVWLVLRLIRSLSRLHDMLIDREVEVREVHLMPTLATPR